MIKANDFIQAGAQFIGRKYSEMDCQKLVENMLAKAGTKMDWRGSNHMAREAVTPLLTVEEMQSQYGMIPPGAWLFVRKDDGKERERGYTDGKGNFAHVGVYLGGDKVIESTTGGVQYTKWPNKKWTHAGLADVIDYTNGIMEPWEPEGKAVTVEWLMQAKSLIEASIKKLEEMK